MQRAWDTVAAYVAANAHNPRKGYRLKDLTDEQQLKYAAAEMTELLMAPGNLDELADLFGCLFHYAMRKGWTLQQIEVEIIRKLELRFPDAAVRPAEEVWEVDNHGFGHRVDLPDELDRMR
jgi:hypothetical protein